MSFTGELFMMIIHKKFPYKRPDENEVREFDNFITLTFGNRAENHIGNECFGFKLEKGFELSEFEKVKEWGGERVKIYDLKKELLDDVKGVDDAYLLVIEGGIDLIGGGEGVKDKLYDELNELKVDKKFWNTRTKKVLNKRARWNFCIGEFERLEPNYEAGEGRVYKFENLEYTNKIRVELGKLLGEKGSNLMGEINKYYDPDNCGVYFHGDREREIVVGVRMGKMMPIVFQWYYNSERKGKKFVLNLKHGDIYIMSDKAVGKDWMKKKIYTLRHAAGGVNFFRKYEK